MLVRSGIRVRVTVAGAMAALVMASTAVPVSADPPNFGCGRGQELIPVAEVRTSYVNAGATPHDALDAWLVWANRNGDDYLCLVPSRNPEQNGIPEGFLNVVDNHAAVGD